MRLNAIVSAITFRQFRQRRLDGGFQHLLVERRQLVTQLLGQARHLANGMGQLFLQNRHRAFNTLAIILGKCFKSLGRHHLAVIVGRGESEASRGGKQQNIVLQGLAAYRLDQVPLPLAHRLLQLMHTVLVLIAFKHGGKGGAQLLGQLFEIGTQQPAHTGRQLQVQRLRRLLEVVAVGKIGR